MEFLGHLARYAGRFRGGGRVKNLKQIGDKNHYHRYTDFVHDLYALTYNVYMYRFFNRTLSALRDGVKYPTQRIRYTAEFEHSLIFKRTFK